MGKFPQREGKETRRGRSEMPGNIQREEEGDGLGCTQTSDLYVYCQTVDDLHSREGASMCSTKSDDLSKFLRKRFQLKSTPL